MTTALREQICTLAKSMFDRALTGGSTGNISARTSDGGLLVSPTGTSFGRLDPARLSHFDARGMLIGGDGPTKEIPRATTEAPKKPYYQNKQFVRTPGLLIHDFTDNYTGGVCTYKCLDNTASVNTSIDFLALLYFCGKGIQGERFS